MKLVSATKHIENHELASMQCLTQLFELFPWLRKEAFFSGNQEFTTEVVKKAAGCTGDYFDESCRDASRMLEPVGASKMGLDYSRLSIIVYRAASESTSDSETGGFAVDTDFFERFLLYWTLEPTESKISHTSEL